MPPKRDPETKPVIEQQPKPLAVNRAALQIAKSATMELSCIRLNRDGSDVDIAVVFSQVVDLADAMVDGYENAMARLASQPFGMWRRGSGRVQMVASEVRILESTQPVAHWYCIIRSKVMRRRRKASTEYGAVGS